MEIKAFRGWRYHTGDGDLSSVLAPPYDILNQCDKDALLAGSARNIVAVDLPHVPPADAGPDCLYRDAADRLNGWMRDGVLVREVRSSLYAYEQAYEWAGRKYRRRAMIAAVRVRQFGQGVWPHERTFPGTTADRLKLTEMTGMQVSPVFGIYEDENTVSEILFEAASGRPAAHGRLAGVEHNLWVVSDRATVKAIGESLADRPLFIADGHHRYTMALEYRKRLGQVGEDHPANYVVFVLVAMEDPGLIILPPHRVITGMKGFDLERFVSDAGRVMDFQRVELGEKEVADADGFLRRFGAHAMAFAAANRPGAAPAAFVGRLKDRSVMRQLAPDQVEAWRELDVSILHRLLIDHCLAECKTDDMSIDYVADGKAALAAASGRADLVVFLQATPLQAVREIALAGSVMPRKSTYFYPKPATGMVLYSLR